MQATVFSERTEKRIKKHYASVAERVAQSSISFRNYKFHDATKEFPNEPHMRTVEQFFPYAVGGELLVDSPSSKVEIAECARKAEVFKRMGYRYLIVEPDMDEHEALYKLENE